MITSFLNNFAIIEPYERKVYHLDLHNYISQVEKKNVLFKKTHVMTSVISLSFFTAIDVILRFCETFSSNDETD